MAPRSVDTCRHTTSCVTTSSFCVVTFLFFVILILCPLLCGVNVRYDILLHVVVHFISRHCFLFVIILHFVQPTSLLCLPLFFSIAFSFPPPSFPRSASMLSSYYARPISWTFVAISPTLIVLLISLFHF